MKAFAMRLGRLSALLLVATFITTAAAAVPAQAAQQPAVPDQAVAASAAPSAASACPPGWFCLWRGRYFTGPRWQFSSPGWHDLGALGGPFGSVYDRRGRAAFLHRFSRGQPETCIEPGERISSLGRGYAHARWLYLAAHQNHC